MISFFYKFQTMMVRKYPNFFSKITYRLIFFVLRFIVPLYYYVTPQKHIAIKNNEEKVLVSLTSFPARITEVWKVLESLTRQTMKPDKIILWLASSQFEGKKSLPDSVLKYESRGVEIKFVEDIRSHKKYYYAIRDYSDYHLITVDDDLFYPENLIEMLYQKHLKHPKSIICNRVHQMTFKRGILEPYSNWKLVYQGEDGPNKKFFPTTGAGTFFPRDSLAPNVLDKNVFMDICLTADDIWLKCMAHLQGTDIMKVSSYYCEMYPVFKAEDGGLQEINVVNGKNDLQLRSVMEFYGINFEEI